MSITDRFVQFLVKEAIEDAIAPLLVDLAELRIRLETFMTATADAIALLNTETSALAARVEAVMGRADAETAALLGPIANRLRLIASDPADPVPGEPTPTDPSIPIPGPDGSTV